MGKIIGREEGTMNQDCDLCGILNVVRISITGYRVCEICGKKEWLLEEEQKIRDKNTTIKELKEYCKQNNIKYSKMNKKELLNKVKEHKKGNMQEIKEIIKDKKCKITCNEYR